MCSAKTAGRRKFVRVCWKLTPRTKSMPRKGQSENSAKRRRFATGRFMPTEFRSPRPIFRPEGLGAGALAFRCFSRMPVLAGAAIRSAARKTPRQTAMRVPAKGPMLNPEMALTLVVTTRFKLPYRPFLRQGWDHECPLLRTSSRPRPGKGLRWGCSAFG